MKKTIVVSAVNVVVGGTLTILQDCLKELSDSAIKMNLRVVAIVHSKDLAMYPNVEYIEIKWAKKTWLNRLWAEYFYMKKVSKRIGVIDMWLSLHDTTPNVEAKSQSVYCHNSFLVYKHSFSDLFYNYKIVFFSLFTHYFYKINLNRNKYIFVQQQWLKDEFIKRYRNIEPSKIVLSIPSDHDSITISNKPKKTDKYQFLYASSGQYYKNFHIICEAAEILNKKGVHNFEALLTISDKGYYEKRLLNKYSHNNCLKFIGFQTKENLYNLYSTVDCLIFSSKVESWGLPISEFSSTKKPMLLADLPYAHSTSEGSHHTAFFNPNNACELAQMMERLINGDTSDLHSIPATNKTGISTSTWSEIVKLLIQDKKQESHVYAPK